MPVQPLRRTGTEAGATPEKIGKENDDLRQNRIEGSVVCL
jgi:hypothetical protein